MFLDESGFRLGSPPRYGWAPKGEDCIGRPLCGSYKQMTIIGAVHMDGFRGVMTIMSGTTKEVFTTYLREVLGPHLRPGDMVVMDNLSTHKMTIVHEILATFGATALFIPPYSPELNPIENVWSKMKTFLRRAATSTIELFNEAMTKALEYVTTKDIKNFIRHAGYSIK